MSTQEQQTKPDGGASVLSDVLCLGDMTMKCEHCGQPAMRGFWICKRCWEIFGDDE